MSEPKSCLIPCAVHNDNRCCRDCGEPCEDMLGCREKEGRCGMEENDGGN